MIPISGMIDFSSTKTIHNSVMNVLTNLRKNGISKVFQRKRFNYDQDTMGLCRIIIFFLGVKCVDNLIEEDELEFLYELIEKKISKVTICQNSKCNGGKCVYFSNTILKKCVYCKSPCKVFCHKCHKLLSYSNMSRHKKSCVIKTIETPKFQLNHEKIVGKENVEMIDSIPKKTPILHTDEYSFHNKTKKLSRKRKFMCVIDNKDVHYLPFEKFDKEEKKRKINYLAIGSIVNNNNRKENLNPSLRKVTQPIIENSLKMSEFNLRYKYPGLRINFEVSAENKLNGDLYIPKESYSIECLDQKQFVIQKQQTNPEATKTILESLKTKKEQWLFILEFLIGKSSWQKNKEKYGFLDYSTIARYCSEVRRKNVDLFLVYKFSKEKSVITLDIERVLPRIFSNTQQRVELLESIIKDFTENLKIDFKGLKNFSTFIWKNKGISDTNQDSRKLNYENYFALSGDGNEILFSCCLNMSPDGTSCGNTKILDLWANFSKFSCFERKKQYFIPISVGNKIEENYGHFSACFGTENDKNSLNSLLLKISERRSFQFPITNIELNNIFSKEHIGYFFSEKKTEEIIKKVSIGKIRVKFSFTPDLKCGQGFVKKRLITPLLSVTKKNNHDLYINENGSLKPLEELFFPSEFIQSLDKDIVPLLYQMYKRKTTSNDVISFRKFINLLVDALHCSFSYGRAHLGICVGVSDTIEFFIEPNGFRKRSKENMKQLLVDKFNIIQNIDSFDVRDDAVEKIFSEEFLNSFLYHIKNRIKNIKEKTLKKIISSNDTTSQTVDSIKENIERIIKVYESVVPKTRLFLQQILKGEKKSKEDCLQIAKCADHSLLFNLLLFFLDDSIPHYLLLTPIIIHQIYTRKKTDTNHIPENLNSALKFIAMYHSSRFNGSFSDISYKNMMSRNLTEKNDSTLHSLLTTFERLFVGINPKTFENVYFGEESVLVSKESTKDIEKKFPTVSLLDACYRKDQSFKGFKGTKVQNDFHVLKEGMKKVNVRDINSEIVTTYGLVSSLSTFFRDTRLFRKSMKIKLVQAKNSEGNFDAYKVELPEALNKYMYNHQKEAIKFIWKKEILKNENWCRTLLLSSTGTGKSSIILIAIKLFLDNCLFRDVCPICIITTKSVSFEWISQNKELCNKFGLKKYRLRHLDEVSNFVQNIIPEIVDWENRSEQSKIFSKHYILVISISFLKNFFSNHKELEYEKDGLKYKVVDWLKRKFELVIIDEIQEFSENEIEIVKNISRERTLVLTATCVKNKFSDYIEVLKVLKKWDSVKKKLNQASNNKANEVITFCDSYTTTKPKCNEQYIKKVMDVIDSEMSNVVHNTQVNVEQLLLQKEKKKFVYKYIIVPQLSRKQAVVINFLSNLYFFSEKFKLGIINLLNIHQILEQILFGYYTTTYNFLIKNRKTILRLYSKSKMFKELVDSLHEIKLFLESSEEKCNQVLSDFILKEKIDPSVEIICRIISFMQQIQEKRGIVSFNQVQVLKKIKEYLNKYDEDSIKRQKVNQPFRKSVHTINTKKIVEFYGEDSHSSSIRRKKMNDSKKELSILLASKEVIKVGLNCNWNVYQIVCGIDWSFSNDFQTMARIIRLSNEEDCFIFRIFFDDILSLQKLGVNIRKNKCLKIVQGNRNINYYDEKRLKETHRSFSYINSNNEIINEIHKKIKPLIKRMYQSDLLYQ